MLRLRLTSIYLCVFVCSSQAQTFVNFAPPAPSQIVVIEDVLPTGEKFRRLVEFVPGRGRNDRFGLNEKGELLNVWDENSRRLVYDMYRNWTGAPEKVKRFVRAYEAVQKRSEPVASDRQQSVSNGESHDSKATSARPVAASVEKTTAVSQVISRSEAPLGDTLSWGGIFNMGKTERPDPQRNGPNPKRAGIGNVGYATVGDYRKLGEFTEWNHPAAYTTKGHLQFENYVTEIGRFDRRNEVTITLNDQEKPLEFSSFLPKRLLEATHAPEHVNVVTKIDPETKLPKPVAAVIGVMGNLKDNRLRNDFSGALVVKIGETAADSCIVAGLNTRLNNRQVEQVSGQRVRSNDQGVIFYTDKQKALIAESEKRAQDKMKEILAAVERNEFDCATADKARITHELGRPLIEGATF